MFFFWLCLTACGILILVPQSEFELVPPALEAQNLNYRTAREVPVIYNICMKFTFQCPWIIKFYCNMAMLIQLHIVCDCFCVITRVEKLWHRAYGYWSLNSLISSQVAQWWRICLPSGRHGFYPWVRKIPWGRKWQPTPVFLPGKSHGQGSLVGYSAWGRNRVRHEWATKQPQPPLLKVWRPLT